MTSNGFWENGIARLFKEEIDSQMMNETKIKNKSLIWANHGYLCTRISPLFSPG